MTNTLKKISKRDITVIMGDFNAKVGNVNIPPVTGGEGLGKINERGERLIDFCMEQEICLTNTWFKQHQRRLYTWTSPDGNTKNQIDYIGINRKWKTCINNCKTYPGADRDTDHNLLIATMKVRLARQKRTEMLKRLDVEELNGSKGYTYETKIANRFEALKYVIEEKTPNELWEETKKVLITTAEEIVGYKKRDWRKPWITEETLNLIDKKTGGQTKR